MTSDKRAQILQMIQSGHLSAEDGAQILKALEEARQVARPWVESRAHAARQFRIRVTDLETGKQKVDFNLPLSMIGVGVKMGARLMREEIKLEDFTDAIKAGFVGKLADMVDEETLERVEIFCE